MNTSSCCIQQSSASPPRRARKSPFPVWRGRQLLSFQPAMGTVQPTLDRDHHRANITASIVHTTITTETAIPSIPQWCPVPPHHNSSPALIPSLLTNSDKQLAYMQIYCLHEVTTWWQCLFFFLSVLWIMFSYCDKLSLDENLSEDCSQWDLINCLQKLWCWVHPQASCLWVQSPSLQQHLYRRRRGVTIDLVKGQHW